MPYTGLVRTFTTYPGFMHNFRNVHTGAEFHYILGSQTCAIIINISCCCLPTPMTLPSGKSDVPVCGSPASFSVHLASSAVTPAGSVYKSRGDNVVSTWVQLKMMINISSCPPLSHLHVLKCQNDYYLTLLTTLKDRRTKLMKTCLEMTVISLRSGRLRWHG